MRITKTLKTGLIAALILATMTSAMAATAKTRVVAHDRAACAHLHRGQVRCLAIERTLTVNGIKPNALVEPNGQAVFGLAALRKAYGVHVKGAKGFTVAVVDAFHAGSAFDDLNEYRKTWGLEPLTNCSDIQTNTTTQCFKQVDQNGDASTGDTTDVGWAQGTVLDIEMVTAMCPSCSIEVVEASSASFSDFNAAVAQATAQPGVIAISNSYGGSEANEKNYPAYEAAYQAGVTVVASAGDNGYGVESPASFRHVIAVGGTSLYVKPSGSYLRETAWKGSGSGCAKGLAPEWQSASLTHCPGKAVADVSAVADPATGVAVYFDGQWLVFGGTSASAPIVAGLFAAKHNALGRAGGKLSAGAMLWAAKGALHDVSEGLNGGCQLFCASSEGWDGPTGLGSPKGTLGF